MSNSSSNTEPSTGVGENAINDYLSNKADVNATLDSICLPIEANYQSTGDVDAVQGSLWNLWLSFENAAEQISYNSDDQQRLVDLIVALANRPTLERNGQPCLVSDMTMWKDLPIFGWQWREAWNFNPSTNTDPQEQTAWLNLNAWTSRITTASSQQSISPLDFSLYGIWTIREGLEDAHQPTESAVEAAAIWLIYGAPFLYDLSQQSKPFQGKLAAPGAAFQDRDWKGYSMDRWKVWADRLADVLDSMSNERAAKLIWQARDAMAACETS